MSQYNIYDIYHTASGIMHPAEKNHVTDVILKEGVIPIVFVPGVMGSNIKNSKGLGKWRVDGPMSVIGWYSKTAEERKRILDPDSTEVDPEGKVLSSHRIERKYKDFKTKKTIPPEYLAKARGWGEVGNMSYGKFLPWLENKLNPFMQIEVSYWKQELSRYYQEINKATPNEAGEVAKDNINNMVRFHYPVHACGYNWLQSNAESAKRLSKKVDEIISGYKKSGMMCNKVILVTHSMGGLVARYYSEVLGGKKNILGVIHGVMPTIGAGVFYRRMKCGTEGGYVASKVMGHTGVEMTAVLAQSPGPLELVPTPDYGTGWLNILKDNKKILSLPKDNNPYNDIYLEKDGWWGMMTPEFACPDRQPSIPGGHVSQEKKDRIYNEIEKWREDRPNKLRESWVKYSGIINYDVKVFHNSIRNSFNSKTYLFYSDSKEYLSYGEISWKGEEKQNRRRGGTVVHSNSIEVLEKDNVKYIYTINEADEPGDGTVPSRSGMVGAKEAISSITVSTEHEPAYNNELARRFTLASILSVSSGWYE